MSLTHLSLTPAYGRDYRSQKQVLEAINSSDVDFVSQPSGHKITGPEALRVHSIQTLSLRYAKLRKQIIVYRDDKNDKWKLGK